MTTVRVVVTTLQKGVVMGIVAMTRRQGREAGVLAERCVRVETGGMTGGVVEAMTLERGKKTGALAERGVGVETEGMVGGVEVAMTIERGGKTGGEISLASFSIASVFLISCSCRTAISLISNCASALIFLRSLSPSRCLECRGRWLCVLVSGRRAGPA